MTFNNTINRLKERIHKEIPISEVIKSRLPTVNGMTLCPFHKDKSIGSFHYSDQKGIYTCFACGEKGDHINFISHYDGVDFVESVLRISYEFSLITESEYNKLSRNKGFNGERKIVSVHPQKEAEIKPLEFRDFVYREMSRSLPLTKKHRDYLYSRGLTDEDIINGGYFSFTGKDVIQLIVNRLVAYGYSDNDLIGVPGFYKDSKSGKISMQRLQGIAIPMIDYDDAIRAIQVRNDEVKGIGVRYIFFSSTKKENGCSSGAPTNVIYPEERKNKDVYITEGHFKAITLSKAMNSIVISVQGINNISPLKEDLLNLDADRIIIAYDADIYRNIEVFKASKRLSQLIKEILPDISIYYLIWNPKTGKGVDDSLNNGNRNFRLIEFTQYEKFYEKYLAAINKSLSTKGDIKEVSDEELLKRYLTIFKKE